MRNLCVEKVDGQLRRVAATTDTLYDEWRLEIRQRWSSDPAKPFNHSLGRFEFYNHVHSVDDSYIYSDEFENVGIKTALGHNNMFKWLFVA